MAGETRDCQCKRARHQHGTPQGYVIDRCRCDECRSANTARERQRNRAKLYGRYEGYVDADPVREHIRALSSAGVGLKTITIRTGVSGGQLCSILYGRGRRGAAPRRPQRSVTVGVRAKILAVPLDADLAPGARVDGIGTRRRLQALVAVGWSQSKLAERLGMAPANFGKTMRAQRVTVATAAKVRALYDQLWDTAPPHADHRQAIAYSRAINHARRCGWLPPLTWDDDSIDDPAFNPEKDDSMQCVPDESPCDIDEIAVERAMRGERVSLSKAEQSEAFTRLNGMGLSASQIGQRLGVTGRTIVRKRSAA